jgi:hypothetical protein
MVVIRITRCFLGFVRRCCLSSEAVQGPALPLEGVNDVESRYGLAAGVLGVGDCITDDVLQEHLEHPPGLLVDQARDALDPSTASQSADSGLGDALDVVPQDLPVPLGSSLACRLDSSVSCRFQKAERCDKLCTKPSLSAAEGGFWTKLLEC